MNKRLLTGLIAAPFTPMHEDGSLNLQVIGPYAEFLMQKKFVARRENPFLWQQKNERLLRKNGWRQPRENWKW